MPWDEEECGSNHGSPIGVGTGEVIKSPHKKKLYIDSKNVSIDILYCYRTRIMRSCHLLNHSLQTSIK